MPRMADGRDMPPTFVRPDLGSFWNSGLWAQNAALQVTGLSPGETLSRAGGWLGDLPGASRMVAAPAP